MEAPKTKHSPFPLQGAEGLDETGRNRKGGKQEAFQGNVTRCGDSLESGEGVKGKEIFPARERGSMWRELSVPGRSPTSTAAPGMSLDLPGPQCSPLLKGQMRRTGC